MSFGWSAGDIVSAITLVNQIITCVGNAGGAREHFQELESELGGLQKALKEIAELTSLPDQIPEIVALKFAACLCEETLKRFYEKIKPFDESLGASSRKSKVKAAPRMVRWELLVKKDVPEFRTYLVAHVGSLNVRLNTAILKLGARTLADNRGHHIEQLRASNAIEQQLSTEYTRLFTQTQAIVEKIAILAQQDSAPRLDSLFAVATNVWKAQHEMMEMFTKAIQSVPPPDLNHTWAQAPIKFEDALGRVMPVPSEYNWDKFEAIIQAQFKNGPGSAKVRSGEYELFMGMTSVTPLKSTDFRPLPGTKITMTFILGQYIGSERCPRLGCSSRSFRTDDQVKHGRICMECQSWFRKSGAMLPKPLKPPAQSFPLGSGKDVEQDPDSKYSKLDLQYDDRRAYKNLSIYITELPPTPTRFRDKYTRNYHSRKSDFLQSMGKVGQKVCVDQSDNFHRKENNQSPKIIQHTGHREFVPSFEMFPSIVPKAPTTFVPPDRPQTHQMRFIPLRDPVPQRPGTYGIDHRFTTSKTSSASPNMHQLNSRIQHPGMSSQRGTPFSGLPGAPPFTQNAPQIPTASPRTSTAAEVSHVVTLSNYEANEIGELSFRKGDVITVLESAYKDWWRGFLNEQVGIFPIDYTQILLPGTNILSRRVRARWSYKARDTDELSFGKGDIITKLQPSYEGWQRGFLRGQPGKGQFGIFPLNFVEEYSQRTRPSYHLMPANRHGPLLESSTLNAPQKSDNYPKDATLPDASRKPYARFGEFTLMWAIPQECENWVPGPTGPQPPPPPPKDSSAHKLLSDTPDQERKGKLVVL